MTKDEALRLALEALQELEDTNSYWWQEVDEVTTKKIDPAITAIKAALLSRSDGEAQTRSVVKDEPVAWMFQHEETGRTMCVDAQQLEWGFEKGNPRLKKIAPLYTTPSQRKPLTEQQIKEALADMSALQMPLNKLIPAIARAIEAAHGIKGEAK